MALSNPVFPLISLSLSLSFSGELITVTNRLPCTKYRHYFTATLCPRRFPRRAVDLDVTQKSKSSDFTESVQAKQRKMEWEAQLY